MMKYHEFYFDFRIGGQESVSQEQTVWMIKNGRHDFHVIEYRALEKLKFELAELKFFAEQMNKYVLPGTTDTGDSALVAFTKLTLQNEILKEFFMDALSQGCGIYNRETQKYSYDHMCLSTYEQMVGYALKYGWIEKNQVAR